VIEAENISAAHNRIIGDLPEGWQDHLAFEL
jgi:hypothetical protein